MPSGPRATGRQSASLSNDREFEHPDEKKLAKQTKAAERAVKEADETVVSLQEKIDAVEGDAALRAIAEQHLDLESKVLRETAKLHEGDKENLQLWHQFLLIAKPRYNRLRSARDYLRLRTWRKLLSFHARANGRSFVGSRVATESQGAICVFLDGFDSPMIVRKQDGAFLYATSDLATVEYRMKTFAPDAIHLRCGSSPKRTFSKIFRALEKWRSRMLSFVTSVSERYLAKMVVRFKTRSGSVVGLEPLLDEAVARALAVVCDPERLQKASLELSEEEKQHVASVVGIGAIKYAISHIIVRTITSSISTKWYNSRETQRPTSNILMPELRIS